MPTSIKFTDRSIKGLKPRDRRYEVQEKNGNGLGIRVSPNGTKTWFYKYRLNGHLRRMTLGTYGDDEMSLADAHVAHSAARSRVKEGRDPAKEKVLLRDLKALEPTVSELVTLYLEKWAKARKRSWEQDERVLTKEVLPAWGDRSVSTIRRGEVAELLQGIADRGAPIQANRTLAVIRKMFNFAIGKDIISTNPCTKIPMPGKERPRDRVLSEDEIKEFWHGLEGGKMSAPTRLALRLILVTAQRKGEVVNAEWDEFDMEEGWWTIPAAKAKNEVQHRVPLSSLALEILQPLKVFAGASRWVLPSPRGDKPFSGNALNRALSRDIVKLKVKEPFSPHDLRRTAATHISAMGPEHELVVPKILNHVDSGVTNRTYIWRKYDKQKRATLDAWGERLHAIVDG